MNEKNKVAYNDNIRFLKSMIGSRLESVIQEQYYFQGELDEESMGTLKIKFSNGKEFVFGCDGDSESLSIREGNFSDKGTLETDFDEGEMIEVVIVQPNIDSYNESFCISCPNDFRRVVQEPHQPFDWRCIHHDFQGPVKRGLATAD